MVPLQPSTKRRNTELLNVIYFRLTPAGKKLNEPMFTLITIIPITD